MLQPRLIQSSTLGKFWFAPGRITQWNDQGQFLSASPVWLANGWRYRWSLRPKLPLSRSELRLFRGCPAIRTRVSVRSRKAITQPAWFRAPRVFVSRAWEI